MFASKVLHTFQQAPSYKYFWTTWTCHTTAQQPSTSPFHREEIAALPPSTTQQGGPTAHPHPVLEAPTATAAQNGGHASPPHHEQDAPTAPQLL